MDPRQMCAYFLVALSRQEAAMATITVGRLGDRMRNRLRERAVAHDRLREPECDLPCEVTLE